MGFGRPLEHIPFDRLRTGFDKLRMSGQMIKLLRKSILDKSGVRPLHEPEGKRNDRMLKKPVSKARGSKAAGAYSST